MVRHRPLPQTEIVGSLRSTHAKACHTGSVPRSSTEHNKMGSGAVGLSPPLISLTVERPGLPRSRGFRFAVAHAVNGEHELCLGEPLQSCRFTISFMLC